MPIPKELKAILIDALEQRDLAFNDARQAFDDYTPEDIATFETEQADAMAWVTAQGDERKERLYFIASNDSEGESLSLFVAANEATDAIQEWQEYYERELIDVPDRVFLVPTIEETNPSSWLFAKALAWHDDIEQVGGTL